MTAKSDLLPAMSNRSIRSGQKNDDDLIRGNKSGTYRSAWAAPSSSCLAPLPYRRKQPKSGDHGSETDDQMSNNRRQYPVFAGKPTVGEAPIG
ncbi:hypothetical protein ACLOJK_009871 [Asimina triloba]